MTERLKRCVLKVNECWNSTAVERKVGNCLLLLNINPNSFTSEQMEHDGESKYLLIHLCIRPFTEHPLPLSRDGARLQSVETKKTKVFPLEQRSLVSDQMNKQGQ